MSAPQTTSLLNYISNRGIYGRRIVASSFTINYIKDVAERLKKTDLLDGFGGFTEVGVGLGFKKDSTLLEGYLLFRWLTNMLELYIKYILI